MRKIFGLAGLFIVGTLEYCQFPSRLVQKSKDNDLPSSCRLGKHGIVDHFPYDSQ